ncbi:hypothetical protein [Hymenobacter sp. B81]|uniref:hypothetical protein n=1 Tax=Hymenobacter sp. B81 TaxID=3344878 RepID=UPI0037DD92EB
MTYFSNLRRGALALLLLGPALVACERELDNDDFYREVGGQFPSFAANDFGLAAKYATGEVVRFELRFAEQTSPIKEIRILQKVEPGRDSVLVQTIPYQRAFSRARNSDTLMVNYTVPAGVNKANVRVDAVVVSQNNQTKTRSFSFRLAEPTPTVRVNAPQNQTAPVGATPVPGDVVRFPVVLNEGGINTATSLGATGTLFKDLDSLVVYVQVGATPERRVRELTRRLPATGAQSGAALTVNVDATLPAGSAGQPVVYRFEAKSRFQDRPAPAAPSIRSATAAAPALTPGTPTPLAAPRTVTLTYSGTGGDQAALDLTTFTLVPAAGPLASKDVAITSTAGNTVRLQALTPTSTTPPLAQSTSFVRLTTGGAAAYNAATLNSIRQLYRTAAAANQVTQLDNVVVGDVVVARLRGLDQYVIFTVAGINRTATSVELTLNVKAL